MAAAAKQKILRLLLDLTPTVQPVFFSQIVAAIVSLSSHVVVSQQPVGSAIMSAF